jgi:hypothetical protein
VDAYFEQCPENDRSTQPTLSGYFFTPLTCDSKWVGLCFWWIFSQTHPVTLPQIPLERGIYMRRIILTNKIATMNESRNAETRIYTLLCIPTRQLKIQICINAFFSKWLEPQTFL